MNEPVTWTFLDWVERKIPNDRTRTLLGIAFITVVMFGCVVFLKTVLGE